jgi:hypothetical protein
MMRELDLDDRYGAHVDRAPAATLAPVNLMSLLGLRRSLPGAAVGHRAAQPPRPAARPEPAAIGLVQRRVCPRRRSVIRLLRVVARAQ